MIRTLKDIEQFDANGIAIPPVQGENGVLIQAAPPAIHPVDENALLIPAPRPAIVDRLIDPDAEFGQAFFPNQAQQDYLDDLNNALEASRLETEQKLLDEALAASQRVRDANPDEKYVDENDRLSAAAYRAEQREEKDLQEAMLGSQDAASKAVTIHTPSQQAAPAQQKQRHIALIRRELNFDSFEDLPEHREILAKALSTNDTGLVLVLEHESITLENVTTFLTNNPNISIISLTCNDTSIIYEDCTRPPHFYPTARPSRLDAQIAVERLCARTLTRLLGNNQQLICLKLSHINMTDNEAQALAAGIAHHPAITELDVSFNLIKDDGATAFAEALQFNEVLIKLDLSGNDFGDIGATILAKVLEAQNNTLASLNVDRTKVTQIGKALLDAVSEERIASAKQNALTLLMGTRQYPGRPSQSPLLSFARNPLCEPNLFKEIFALAKERAPLTVTCGLRS